ncbi:MAG: hypothetical protein AB9891_08135 [Anaerolineaceae bacterium]
MKGIGEVKAKWLAPVILIVLVSMACNFQIPAVNISFGSPTDTPQPSQTPLPPTEPPTQIPSTDTPVPSATPEPPTFTPTVSPTVVHLTQPGVPPYRTSYLWDRDSSNTASQNRPSGGDDYSRNLYERPFSAEAQDHYYPDIDIQEGSLSIGGGWVYTAIRIKGPDPESLKMDGTYGVEIDLNQDGRGDLLVLAGSPENNWSTDRVQVWQDSNVNVGGSSPMKADPPQKGDSYETLVFDSGQGPDPDAAWAMVSGQAANTVLLAFKFSLINNDSQFMWGVWADRGLKNPAWFDYHDQFTAAEAGSPLPGVPNYPSKAIFAVDNSCRWAVGFSPNGQEPGICPVPPTPTPIPPTAVPPTTIPNYQFFILPTLELKPIIPIIK